MAPAFIAALPREVRGLVKGWTRRSIAGGVVVYTNSDAVVAWARRARRWRCMRR
jgi:adenosylhomocysteine nucleosidase